MRSAVALLVRYRELHVRYRELHVRGDREREREREVKGTGTCRWTRMNLSNIVIGPREIERDRKR